MKAYELIIETPISFAGQELIINNKQLIINPINYKAIVLELENKLTNKLTKEANSLRGEISKEQNKLKEYLQEKWPFTIRRGSVDLKKHQHMNDGPILNLSVAIGLIEAKKFRSAMAEIKKGERKIFENFKLLYYYANARNYEGPQT